VSADQQVDDLLIERIASGDRDALAELYGRHRAEIYRFAAHMSGLTTLADDIVHEVFVAVIDSASRYRRGRTTVRLWLFGIARNHVRRARSKWRMRSLDENYNDRPLPINRDPVGDIGRQRDVDALNRAIVSLPVRYREAVVLCDLQELSYADAAAAIGCAIGTVRSRLHRGRALLARRLCGTRESYACPLPVTRTIP
jgi:RNA polymerase sigma-70 factor (ECF subfamily)